MSKPASSLDMLHGPIAIKIVSLAIPILISSVLQQLFNAADMVVVGRFAGENSLAAVGANTFVINLMVNLFIGLSIGSNVVIARLIGQGDRDGIGKAVHTSLAVSLISGVMLTVIGWFVAEPVLQAMGTPTVIIGEAVTYFRIYFLGMPFFLLFNFASAILRSKGDTRRPLYVLAGCGVLNIILNIFFVVNLHMNVAGVAWATLITSAISSLILMWMLMEEHGDLKVYLRKISINWRSLLDIAAVGVPAGIQGAIFSFSNVIIQEALNDLGPTAIAASTASLNFEYLSYFAVGSFGQAGMSFLSQNYGAGNRSRCHRVIWISLLLGIGTNLCVSWTFILLRNELASLFCTEPEVIRLAAARMVVVLCLYCINALNDLLSNLMRAVGYSLTPAIICIIGICGTRMLWIYFIFPQNPTFDMLNWCYAVSWVVTMFVMIPTAAVVLRNVLKRLPQNVTA